MTYRFKKTAHMNPFPDVVCRFSDTGEKVQVTKLRAIMAKAVFNPKKLKIITVVSFIRKHDADITGV